MSENVFPNARSRLFGEGEDSEGIIVTPAVAGLSGDVEALDPVLNINFNDVAGGGGTDDSSSPEQVYASVSITVTEPINVIFLRQFSPMDRNNDGGTFRIREDDINGLQIAGAGYGAGNGQANIVMSAIIKNQPVGSRTYVMTREQNTPTSGFTRLQAGATTNNFVVDVDDTHAGFIQSVAIAGKQINTPDSHTTHEQAVLPG